mgnify:CR=1 FL=1
MTDYDYMRRAIELAKKGEGAVDPNPLVGAVIVKNDKIIGEGYHKKYGDLHAERNAFKSITESAEGGTLYVTLEPCCHTGKTPPCTDAIIENKIAKVVIGSGDPNPLVAGKGATVLKNAGIEVVEGFLAEECDVLNDVFFHYITNKTPYVVMKYAMTLDGKIATKSGDSKWITNELSRRKVQEMRNKYTGIMVGIGTVKADDPMLNTRIEGGRSPIRIICDSKLSISADSNICRTASEIKTFVVTAFKDMPSGIVTDIKTPKMRELSRLGIKFINVPAKSDEPEVDLNRLMELLGKLQINSILLEGGGTLNYSALQAGIVNEIAAFIAPKIVGGDAKTPVGGTGVDNLGKAQMLKLLSMDSSDGDIYARYKVLKDKSL